MDKKIAGRSRLTSPSDFLHRLPVLYTSKVVAYFKSTYLADVSKVVVALFYMANPVGVAGGSQAHATGLVTLAHLKFQNCHMEWIGLVAKPVA
jgi:hypothetical protein